MVFLYNLGIRAYLFLVHIVSPFNKKAKLWIDGRRKWQDRVRATVNSDDQTVWVHCSSLGEFEQGRPVIESIKQSFPDLKIVLTFFSPSGYEVRKNYSGADYIFYLPIDTKRNAREFVQLIKPKLVIFVKYEFWYFYLSELRSRNIPTYIISANFRANQVFFKSYGNWYRQFLRKFDHLFVQNQNSLDLLSSIGINNVTVAGDTRFDRVAKVASEAKEFPFVEQFCGSDKIVIAGSTWPKDEEVLAEFFKINRNGVKLIIAPHEIDKHHIESIQHTFPVESILYSERDKKATSDARILIIDCIGMLSSLYRYGHIAYIGGGFGVGIHNTLEAATFGIPVIFGPNYHKFQEAKDLISFKAGFSINTPVELVDLLNSFLNDEQLRINAGNESKKFVLSGVGATSIILNSISPKLH
ncbi:MAG: 3-deoxy-D-manno-octulosonic acid transferase [Bacteroidales bacterium]|nr:MAG: 3-deoxy-D-manno-octulosonic acid transferase [Bacteroidales bacterium]